MSRDRSLFAAFGFWLALLCALAALLSPLGYRLGWWDPRFALLTVLRGAAIGAGVAFVICLVGAVMSRPGKGKSGFGLALIGLVISAALAGYPAYQYSKVQRLPYIHDITTDTDDPPQFIALAEARKAAPNGIEYKGAEIAGEQKRAYPEIGPYTASHPASELFAKAEVAARAAGWEIAAAAPAEGRIEAVDTSLFFGFKDDIVIRIKAEEAGSRLDMRSMSRVGRSDVGVNAARIRCFIEDLKR